jgi:two-component system alkaline phosphatase synthesis response regulator PhoP
MKKILVVDDEPDTVAIVKIVLEEEGYMVSTLPDPTEFKTVVRESKADLVLLDLNIAGFDGKIICEYIKGHDDLKNIPIIFMSANDNVKEVKEACGAEDVIPKPFDLTRLVDTVKSYI